MVASVGGCGDDSLKPGGDENGSSSTIDFDLRWRPGVVVSGFTIYPRSISVLQKILVVPPDGSENRVLCIDCLRSEVSSNLSGIYDVSANLLNTDYTSPWVCGWIATFAGARRVRGLFSINSRSSWVIVGFCRPSSGETPPALALCGDRIGMSSVDDRGDRSEFRNVVIGVGTFCRLRRLLAAAFVGELSGERDG